MLYSLNPCTDFHQIFRVYLPKEDLELIRFWGVSGNNCCHGNTFKIFGSYLDEFKIMPEHLRNVKIWSKNTMLESFLIMVSLCGKTFKEPKGSETCDRKDKSHPKQTLFFVGKLVKSNESVAFVRSRFQGVQFPPLLHLKLKTLVRTF